MIGVLATVLVQSSSTSTSIVITMVGSEIIPLRSAIPIIMGANIGTSVTNTLVSLAQASDRNEFRRAFSGATVHDMFNWISVLVLLPVEVTVHYLERVTGFIVDSLHLQQRGKAPDMLKAITKPLTRLIVEAPDMPKAITKPLTRLIVEVDKDVIKNSARGNYTDDDDGTVLKRWCDVMDDVVNVTRHNYLRDVTVNCQEVLTSPESAAAAPLLELCRRAQKHVYTDLTKVSAEITFDSLDQETQERKLARCHNLFAQSDLSDSAVGGILLACSLGVIFLALYGLVKVLHSVLHGHLAGVIRKVVNSDLPGKAAFLTGYIFILVGGGMTMILQSSSVFTSTLTPMVGVGVVTVERMYPLTLGANIGTTLTGILAALSQEGDHLKNALHVAFCHLFFNISGIILFYPVPVLRFPIGMAKALGRTTAKHRWFAIAYLLILFILVPGTVFGLSMAGWVYLGAVGGPLLALFLVVLLINGLQRKKPECLPRLIRNWDFLPLCCHSLKPVDNLIFKIYRCGCCQKLQEADLRGVEDSEEGDVESSSFGSSEQSQEASCTSSNPIMSISGQVCPSYNNNPAFETEEHRL
ncbi:hypothetical protein ACOMHN_066806 [Nucella lapillus]